MVAAPSVIKRCWKLVVMMGMELALSLCSHLHHIQVTEQQLVEKGQHAEKAALPCHCQFSCSVWHSMLSLADSHLCLISPGLPKHLLSFCSLTSV